jgi:hypothetical protein
MKNCLSGLREIEKIIDEGYKKENDLNIEKINKNYTEIERDAQAYYFKRGKGIKENTEKKVSDIL